MYSNSRILSRPEGAIPNKSAIIGGAYFRRIFLVLASIGLTSCIAAGPPASAPPADGNSTMAALMRAYHKLNSYSGQDNVDTIVINKRGHTIKQLASSVVLKFQRPNLLYLYCIMPPGSRGIFCDGKTFTIYDATPRVYQSYPAETTSARILGELQQRAAVTSSLDPLFFLSGKPLPGELTDLKLTGSGTINGRAVTIMTGVTNAHPKTIHVGGQTRVIQTTYWTWWIDSATNMIQKIEARTPNVTMHEKAAEGSKKADINEVGTVVLRHSISEIIPNSTLSPDTFLFTPPKNAHREQPGASSTTAQR